MSNNLPHHTSRRTFLTQAGVGMTAAYLGSQFAVPSLAAAPAAALRGKAEHCILLWLGGGPSQIDTFDPKARGDAKAKKAGSYYDSIDTAIPGVQVCEHLKNCAPLMDRFNLLRTVHHDVIDEHARAANQVHTGRPTAGTITYPSVGSIVAHERGPAAENVPAYVVIGYPSVARGPGFLGTQYSYLYLLDTKQGPAGLARPRDISEAQQARRETLLRNVREQYVARRPGDPVVAGQDAAITEALRLAGPQFMKVFDLDREPADLRNAYGSEFGQRCLLGRRLIQSGVRFIEISHNMNFVNGTGWDTHNEGQLKQHELIQDLDVSLSALVLDLERQKLLDKTLIVVAGEFGRPASFDANGGRGHYSKCFSVVLAGGGLKSGMAIGQSDELAMKILERPISLPDLHATIHAALGIDPHKELYAGERPVPITDQGKPLAELFG